MGCAPLEPSRPVPLEQSSCSCLEFLLLLTGSELVELQRGSGSCPERRAKGAPSVGLLQTGQKAAPVTSPGGTSPKDSLNPFGAAVCRWPR